MKQLLLTLALLCAFLLPVRAEEDPAHLELRAVRDALVACMNRGDIEGQLAYLHPNVVVTWHNAEVSRGRDGVKAYLTRLLQGPDKMVDEYKADLNVDELSILYGGNTAISFGSAKEHFKLTNGRSFDLTGRWTATLVKEGGYWLVASLHTSDNIFDNPLLNQAKRALLWTSGGMLLGGLLIGFAIASRRRRA